MARIDRVQAKPPQPRALPTRYTDNIFAQIPKIRKRDRLMFGLMYECGLRASEATGLYVEDLDLTPDDEHIRVIGKGDHHRTVLLDDPKLVTLLRRYLRETNYRNGSLFRAEKNSNGGPIGHQSAQTRWQQYCVSAGVDCTLHQPRHTHATELVKAGVSLATIRKRLGHKNIQTTLRYAEQSDATADTELRKWRRSR